MIVTMKDINYTEFGTNGNHFVSLKNHIIYTIFKIRYPGRTYPLVNISICSFFLIKTQTQAMKTVNGVYTW